VLVLIANHPVLAHHSFLLQAKYRIQVCARSHRVVKIDSVLCRHCIGFVVRRKIAIGEKLVRLVIVTDAQPA
jgi:hypothetical protein